MPILRNLAPLVTLLLAASPVCAEPNAFLSGVAKWIAMENIPTAYSDEKKWGGQKEFTQGVKFRGSFKNFKVERRKKPENHGTWKRYHVRIVNPPEDLQAIVESIEVDGNKIKSRLSVIVKLTAEGELQEWNRGVRLMGISAVADATIRMTIDAETKVKWNSHGVLISGELEPQVVAADLTLLHWELQRVGLANGQLIEKLGHELRDEVAEKIDSYEPKLVEKANQALDKEIAKGRFKIDLAEWIREQF
ncbi:hypothetical protein [Blastopirellula marina]|uniref:Uncharacterized protein n=1 Tax=Blastopirellula marina TaxID=124 RepID=A0A2S8FTS4_9BACT|nr:hypothetical protein [Blastopirellula marina]PQO35566.1 hypothetical protein C5Y98_13040 [Blastopirellula marina]PQO48074.1 hypothetical protein C5Y93_01435 [Blastopirellula marina]PTL44205.1 hypothetical protein C5Y97_13050 [Blastopirellula marina]